MANDTISIRGELVPAAAFAVDYGADLDLKDDGGRGFYFDETPEYLQLVQLRELSPEVRRAQGFVVDADGYVSHENTIRVDAVSREDVSRFDVEVSQTMARTIKFNARMILENELVGDKLLANLLRYGPRRAIEERKWARYLASQFAELALLDTEKN